MSRRLLSDCIIRQYSIQGPLRFRQAFSEGRRVVARSASWRRTADPTAADIERRLVSLCRRPQAHLDPESLRSINEKLTAHRISRIRTLHFALEYAVKYEQQPIVADLVKQLPDLLQNAQCSDYVKFVQICAQRENSLPRRDLTFILDHIAGTFPIPNLTNSEIIELFAAISRFSHPHHGLILAINSHAGGIIPKLTLREIQAILDLSLSDFNKDSLLIQEINKKVAALLADGSHQVSCKDIMPIFVQFARTSVFNPELAKTASELFPKFASSMDITDLVKLTESVSRYYPHLVSMPEYESHCKALRELHHYLIQLIMPRLRSLSLRSLSMFLSSLNSASSEQMVESALAACDTIVKIPTEINANFAGAFTNSVSIARIYHPSALDRLCSEMARCISERKLTEESFSRHLFGIAMLNHPMPKDAQTAVLSYASSLMRSTSDPSCLVRVLWALAVYDMLHDVDLVMSSIRRLEDLFSSRQLSYCHDVLHRMLPSIEAVSSYRAQFGPVLAKSRRVRSRLYPTMSEFKTRFFEALDAAGISYTRNARVCQSGYRFDCILEQTKTVIALDDRQSFVKNGNHLTGSESIARDFLRSSSWSVIQVPYWDWDKFDLSKGGTLRLLSFY